MDIKLNDVFSFRYHPDVSKTHRMSLYHCFDGQLIAKESHTGSIYLVDTYWGSKYDNFTRGNDARRFTPKKAVEKGVLKFICNLDDVEEIPEWEFLYYEEGDVFNLSYQHHCYKFYVKKKGAKRSVSQMVKVCESKIEMFEYNLKDAQRSIETYMEYLSKIKDGDTNIIL